MMATTQRRAPESSRKPAARVEEEEKQQTSAAPAHSQSMTEAEAIDELADANTFTITDDTETITRSSPIKRKITVRRPVPQAAPIVAASASTAKKRIIVARKYNNAIDSNANTDNDSSGSSDSVKFPPINPSLYTAMTEDDAKAYFRVKPAVSDAHADTTTDSGALSQSQSESQQADIPSAALTELDLLSSLQSRVLSITKSRHSEFCDFQSKLAARVNRSQSSLCMTNAASEYRLRVERSMLNEHGHRIARQAAALHTGPLTSSNTLALDEGGLSLPWEQSLRGAINHNVQIGNMFSGLYCTITEPRMNEMEIIRTNKQIQEERAREGSGGDSVNESDRPSRSSRMIRKNHRLMHKTASQSLIDEALRLEQLNRLTQLGRKRRSNNSALENGEEPLKLTELQIVGTSLFENLSRPATTAETRTHTDNYSGRLTIEDDDDSELDIEIASLPSTSLVYSIQRLSFHQTHRPGTTTSASLTVHNTGDNTVHFCFVRDSGSENESESVFSASVDRCYVLPHDSVTLVVTFAPPAAGLYQQHWVLHELDWDHESRRATAATLALHGVSTSIADTLTQSFRSQLLSKIDSEKLFLYRSETDSEDSCSKPVTLVEAPEQRVVFYRQNYHSHQLYYHPLVMTQWLSLAGDAIQCHKPDDRRVKYWDLSVSSLYDIITTVPPRHSDKVDGMIIRYESLMEQSRVRPEPDGQRVQCLSALLSLVVSGLPLYAHALAQSLRIDRPLPHEERQREEELKAMAEEDAVHSMTDEQQQQRNVQRLDRLTAEKAKTDAMTEEEKAILLAERSNLLELETEAVNEREAKQSEHTAKLRAEMKAVLLAVVSRFDQLAGPEGVDDPPVTVIDASQYLSLPLPFPTVAVEPEVGVVETSAKGKGKQSKDAKAAASAKKK